MQRSPNGFSLKGGTIKGTFNRFNWDRKCGPMSSGEATALQIGTWNACQQEKPHLQDGPNHLVLKLLGHSKLLFDGNATA